MNPRPTYPIRSFSPAEWQALHHSMAEIDRVFDFHQSFAPKDQNRLLRIGTKTLTFVEKMKYAVDNHPWLLPGYVSQTSYETQYKAWKQLGKLEAYLRSLLVKIHHTKLIAAHNLMQTTLSAYRGLKDAVKHGVPGAIIYFERVKIRWEQKWRYERKNNQDAEGRSRETEINGGEDFIPSVFSINVHESGGAVSYVPTIATQQDLHIFIPPIEGSG